MNIIDTVKLFFTRWKVKNEIMACSELILRNSWCLFNTEEDNNRYFFEPNGDLFISEGGRVIKGHWRLLGRENYIYIVEQECETIYSYFLVGDKLFVCYNERTSESKLFYNDTNISRENLELELSIWIIATYSFFIRLLIDGSLLYIENGIVKNNDSVIVEGEFQTVDGENIIVIHGRIVDTNRLWSYSYYEDGLVVKHQDGELPQIGCEMYIHGKIAENGVYRVMSDMYAEVLNGRICRISTFEFLDV